MKIKRAFGFIRKFLWLACLSFSLLLFGCNSESSSDIQTQQPNNGEMASGFTPTLDTAVVLIEQSISEEERLKREGWKQNTLTNGIMPNCYNYRPRYGHLDNKLIVTVGGGTDVVIKMMSISTGRCVRYVFINSGTTYSIKKLPEDQYYLKIAYGKNWISKTEEGMCLGKFLSSPSYEKGEDVLDFNRQVVADGYNVPSFSLKLDVISNSNVDSFNSSGITEDDFNN